MPCSYFRRLASLVDKYQNENDLWEKMVTIAQDMCDGAIYTKDKLDNDLGLPANMSSDNFYLRNYLRRADDNEKLQIAKEFLEKAKNRVEWVSNCLKDYKGILRESRVKLKNDNDNGVDATQTLSSMQAIEQPLIDDDFQRVYELLNRALDDEIKVFLGNMEYSYYMIRTTADMAHFKNLSVEQNPLWHLRDCPIGTKNDTDSRLVNVFKQLHVPMQGENEFRKHNEDLQNLFYNNSEYNVQDTSSRDLTPTAADGTHKEKPMFISFRSTNLAQLLYQTIDRVAAVSTGLFTRAVGFAVDGGSDESYMVVYCREMANIEIVSNSLQQCSITVHKIALSDVLYLWRVLGNQPTGYFASSESGTVVALLNSCGLSPFQCRICLAAKSSSQVYAITVRVKSDNNLSSFKPLMLKVNFHGYRHQLEVAALTAVSEAYHKAGVPFYAHGVVSASKWTWFKNCASTSVLDALKNSQAIDYVSGLPHYEKGWSLDERYDAALVGGILMEFGESFAVTEDFVDDISESLQIIHNAGYVHTDVRSCNMLLFDFNVGGEIVHKHSMIDFDISVLDGSYVDIQRGSGQYDACPSTIKALVDKKCRVNGTSCVVAWSADLDNQMMSNYVNRKLNEKQHILASK